MLFEDVLPSPPPLAEDEIQISVKAHSLTFENWAQLEQRQLQRDSRAIYEIAGIVTSIATSSSSGASTLHSLLRFTNKRTQVKVNTLKTLPIEPNHYLSQSNLETLRL